MDKVFIVLADDARQEGYYKIMGVFKTEQRAKTFAKAKHLIDYYISEWSVK